MADEPKNVLFSFCRIWERQDLAGALELVHDDIVYAMFIPQDVVPFGGETRGKAAMADRMSMILEHFNMQQFETVYDRSVGNVGRARVVFAFRHKITGEVISGTMRLEAEVEDGLIVDFKEYHDIEKIRAFMRLVAYKAAERSPNDC